MTAPLMGYVCLLRCCAGGTATFEAGTRLDTAQVEALPDRDELLMMCAIKRVEDDAIPQWLADFAAGLLDGRGDRC